MVRGLILKLQARLRGRCAYVCISNDYNFCLGLKYETEREEALCSSVKEQLAQGVCVDVCYCTSIC